MRTSSIRPEKEVPGASVLPMPEFGKQVQKSLLTSSEKVAMAKKRRLDYELSLGDLHVASQLPITTGSSGLCT